MGKLQTNSLQLTTFLASRRQKSMKINNLLVATVVAAALGACGGNDADAPSEQTTSNEIVVTDAELEGNPFRQEWDTPYGVPPFADIEDSHYLPAIKKGILERRDEIAAIANNPDAPTFENTIVAFETAGENLYKVRATFANITGTELTDELSEVQQLVSPMLSRETSAMMLNEKLFERVQSVYAQKDALNLDEQDARLLELVHRSFVRAGAALGADAKQRLADVNAEIAGLSTKFGLNVLAANNAFSLEITNEADLAGLSDDFKTAIWNEEKGAWVVGIKRSSYESFMTQSENRELRAKAFDGYRLKANAGEIDNGPVLIRISQLRAERARLLGYESHAHYQLETRMAKTPAAAEEFLLQVLRPALETAKQELADMQALVGDEYQVAAHDWWHLSEKVRLERFNVDESATKPYFELTNVRNGAFEMANRLFGVTFEEVDVEGWNPVVQAFDVKNSDGEHLGLFMVDMYTRDSKRFGAWMNSYRVASKASRPIITNNMNLIMPPEGEPTLMRLDEVETLFHEFGHGLHGLMTQIDYRRFAGTSGSPRDYTEFPAQILEHWATQPDLLEIYARHYETGELISADLVERLRAAANHNGGFQATEFIAASLIDLAWHSLTVEQAAAITDAREFEKEVLARYGVIEEIEPRYRSQYFLHVFSSGYSAGYYAYYWSEILDADGFDAFRQAEDIWDPELAGRLKKWVYESGGLREADELYRNFRGQDPTVDAMLRGRGFVSDET